MCATRVFPKRVIHYRRWLYIDRFAIDGDAFISMSRGGDRCQRIYTSNGRNMFIYVKLPRRSLWTGWWAMMPNYRALCTADQRIYWGRLHANRKGVVGVAGVYWAGKTEADDLFKFNCGERAFVRVVCRMLWTVNGCRRFVCVWCI